MAITKMADTPAATAPPAFKVNFKSFDAKTTVQSSLILLVGRQGHGKTTTALTLSEKFDVNGPPGQVIDDILIVTNEKGALDCARHCVSEFKYWFDLTDYTDQPLSTYLKVEAEVLKEAKALVQAGIIKGVVYDNASTRDKILASYKANEKEGWPLINWLLMMHREFVMSQLLPIPCNIALTAHTQPVKSATPIEKETYGIDATDREVINMTGIQAAGLYRAQSSLIVPVFKKEKGGKDEFFLDLKGKNGQESKIRFKAIVEAEMEPNLRKLLSMTVGEK